MERFQLLHLLNILDNLDTTNQLMLIPSLVPDLIDDSTLTIPDQFLEPCLQNLDIIHGIDDLTSILLTLHLLELGVSNYLVQSSLLLQHHILTEHLVYSMH